MADYRIVLARSAGRELEKLPAGVVERIFPKIEALAAQPRPPGCKKLKGGRGLWRIRVGDYRVIYSVEDGPRVVDIVTVRHRGEAYRD